MGTIQKIIDNMEALRGEKTVKLTSRFDEHSAWLHGEFSLIKQLIQQKNTQRLSSDGKNAEVKEKAAKEEMVAKARAAASSSSQSTDSSKVMQTAVGTENAATSDMRRHKRKSPEQSLNPVKLSPEQKRNSTDFDKIIADAGLPSDLNRMRKDDLLQELSKRGNESLNMKCLKRDIVDTLKAVLLQEYREKEQQQGHARTDPAFDSHAQSDQGRKSDSGQGSPEKSLITMPQVEPVSGAKGTVSGSPTLTGKKEEEGIFSPVRVPSSSKKTYAQDNSSPSKMSGNLFADFRNQLQMNAAATKTSPSSDLKKKQAQTEFERRQSKAQARRSAASEASVVEDVKETGAGSFAEQKPAQQSVASVAPSAPSAVTPVSNEIHAQKVSPAAAFVKTLSPSTTRPSDVSVSEDIWMEVASPQPDRTIATLQNGINLELTGNSPVKSAVAAIPKEEPPIISQAPILKQQQQQQQQQQSRGATQGNSLMNLGATKTMAARVPPVVSQSKEPSPKAKSGAVAEKIAAIEKSGNTPGNKIVSESKPNSGSSAGLLAPNAAAAFRALKSPFKSSDNTLQQNFSIKKEDSQFSAPSFASASTAAATKPANKFADAVVEKPVKKGLFSFLAGKPKDESVAKAAPVAAVPESIVPSAAKPVVIPTAVAPKPTESKQTPTMKLTPSALAINPKLAPAPVPAPAPAPAPAPTQSADEYKIADDDSDGDSGTDDDDDNNKKQNRIPDWARGAQLKEALEKQYGMYGHKPIDPDNIFMEVQTCSLEEIFGTTEGRSGKYSHRSSSAKWDADEITLVEKRTYRNQMGLPVN